MRIAIYGNKHQEKFLTGIEQLFQALARRNAWVEIDNDFYDYLSEVLPAPPPVNDVITPGDDFSAAIALSIGGDGTFLRTAQWVAAKDIPILGVNTGHLGYLADANIASIDSMIDNLFSNNYKTECRTLLEIASDTDTVIAHPFALNEVAILRQDTSSMISVYTEINGSYLTTYMGDGLIVSTPTGSTAYNLSVGGPILDPMSESMVISPISPHSLTMRPLVVRDDSSIRVTTSSRMPLYRVSLDGHSISLPTDSSILIRKAPFTVKVIQFPGHNFADTLRNKLLWGSDLR